VKAEKIMRATAVLSHPFNRRELLKAGALSAGGLLISIALPPLRSGRAAVDGQPALTAFLHIGRDGSITAIIPSSEMGQGVATSEPMLLAEELEVDWRKVNFTFAPAAPAYINPIFHMQGTGGSTSTRAFFVPLRQAGAAAREMLRQAAAAKWGVPVAKCKAVDGRIVHVSGKSESYAALADDAAKLPVPSNVPLKPSSAWKLIGKPTPRLDTPPKVDGSAIYGVDVRIPAMLVGTIAHCPVLGGTLKAVDDKPAMAVKGVKAVVRLPNAVAVVGDGYWPAKKGLMALKPQWEEGANASLDSSRIAEDLSHGLATEGAVAESSGDAAAALNRSAKKIDVTYTVPYLAHATMEPMNATAYVHAGGCEVWAPMQIQGMAQHAVAAKLGISPEQVKIHTTYLGGGFGRRGEVDYTLAAIMVSKSVGKPVKLIWSREEDIQHDFYRPVSAARMRAGLDSAGKVTAWDIRIASPSIMSRVFPQRVRNRLDPSSVDGAIESPYAPQHRRIEYVMSDIGVPVGFWRSVGNSISGFYVEGLVDELAHAAGRDPFAFRRDLLAHSPRHKAVLEKAAAMARWSESPRPGHFRGIAMHPGFGSIVAQVAEISIGKDGLRVHRVDCAVDCGIGVNPSTIVAQMESGIVFGLTAALFGEITIERGRVKQANFDTYPMIGLSQMPAIEVAVIQSGNRMGGIGEPGTPPIAPALVNAIFAATGKRLRSLPIAKSGISIAG
jgi:isoquinoline 1-oxidoreductase beta subunit